jgi:LSD1 subclass zinc finger protein
MLMNCMIGCSHCRPYLAYLSGAKLRIRLDHGIDHLDHPFVALWLKQHGQRISHLSARILVSSDRLKLRDFAEAAAPCKSIDLIVNHFANQVLDLADLEPVAGIPPPPNLWVINDAA